MEQLYGGAITTTIPRSSAYQVVDVSQLRQVPDCQEVFLLEPTESHLTTNQGPVFDKSIIFDILELVHHEYPEAIKIHIQDLVDSDEQPQNHPIDAPLPGAHHAQTTSFIVHPIDRKDATPASPQTVLTFISLLRLTETESDLVITMNIPLRSQYLDSQVAQALEDPEDPIAKDYALFKSVCQNFKIVDWNLFE